MRIELTMAAKGSKKEEPKYTKLLPVLVLAVAIPGSLSMWIGNLAFSFFTQGANAAYSEGKYVYLLIQPIKLNLN